MHQASTKYQQPPLQLLPKSITVGKVFVKASIVPSKYQYPILKHNYQHKYIQNNMQYRRLGKAGVQVSVLSFGAWITFGKQIGDTTAEDLMKAAYDGGVNFFDNAEAYSRGEAERVMGNILNKMGWERSSFLVSSKAYFGDGGRKPNQTGLSRKHLFEACHAALKRLQVDYLDLFFCHRPDKNTPIEETVWAMNHLIQQGKILYWGTSKTLDYLDQMTDEVMNKIDEILGNKPPMPMW